MRTDTIPDRLTALWRKVEAKQLTADRFSELQDQALAEYRRIWTDALLLPGETLAEQSFCRELSEYFDVEPRIVEERCRAATRKLQEAWSESVNPEEESSIEAFYDSSEHYIYELMWWHTLLEDHSPLSYVVGLEHAKARNGRDYLDFGSGVGAGGLLFARHGFDVTLADVSSTMLQFAGWRSERHKVKFDLLDLKTASLPDDAFDFVTAMDVFEHLADPVAVVDDLARSIRPGGLLFGRFHGEVDELRPQHIVTDFEPTFARLRHHNFHEIWRDEWLWGHQLFEKR